MKYKIITSILFAILLQTNGVYVSAQILNSTENKELGTNRNASLGYFNKFLKTKGFVIMGKNYD